MNIDHIAGHVLAFSLKNDDQVLDTPIPIEVTDATRDGVVEIAFNTDFGQAKPKRVYVRFRLPDLMAALMKHVKPE